MPHPKHRRTSSDKRRRAAHFGLEANQTAVCGTCGKPVRPHHACLSCGTYKSREVLDQSRVMARALKNEQAVEASAEPVEEPAAEPAKEEDTKDA